MSEADIRLNLVAELRGGEVGKVKETVESSSPDQTRKHERRVELLYTAQVSIGEDGACVDRREQGRRINRRTDDEKI